MRLPQGIGCSPELLAAADLLKTGWPGLRLHRLGALAASLSLAAAQPAHAVDGCQVLLCLAAPNWRAVAQCVPPVRQVFRDLARGKPFPTCSMAGGGNTTAHTWADAPSFCPPQYTRSYDGPNGQVFTCDFDGAISVTVQGVLFARTWWSGSGDSSTEFSPAAKARLGAWDTRFEADYAAWMASKPVPGSN